MMHTTQALYDNLGSLLLEINQQIEAMKKDTQKAIEVLPYPDLVTVYDMKNNTDGTFVLADLLLAKAEVLSAMANLKLSSMKR